MVYVTALGAQQNDAIVNLYFIQESVEKLYSDLVRLSAARNHALIEARQLHQFTRECEDVEAWVCEKELVAANEDLGKDVEHVEVCV